MSKTRQLILLRHAQALPAQAGQEDHARPLSAAGQREAEAAADFIAARAAPQQVLCSTAQRTRETAARVCPRLGLTAIRYEPRIYEATAGQLLALLEAEAEADCLLLVGHNPGLEQLLALLAPPAPGKHRGMAPAAVAVLHVSSGAVWQPGCATLAAFWAP